MEVLSLGGRRGGVGSYGCTCEACFGGLVCGSATGGTLSMVCAECAVFVHCFVQAVCCCLATCSICAGWHTTACMIVTLVWPDDSSGFVCCTCAGGCRVAGVFNLMRVGAHVLLCVWYEICFNLVVFVLGCIGGVHYVQCLVTFAVVGVAVPMVGCVECGRVCGVCNPCCLPESGLQCWLCFEWYIVRGEKRRR